MAQAKTLSKQELKRVLDYNDACERHSERNRAMLLFTHLCGMRIGEVVALRVRRIDDNGEVKGELRLVLNRPRAQGHGAHAYAQGDQTLSCALAQ